MRVISLQIYENNPKKANPENPEGYSILKLKSKIEAMEGFYTLTLPLFENCMANAPIKSPLPSIYYPSIII